MSFKPQGKHLIAGQWVATEQTFVSQPIEGPTYHFSVGNIELVNQACEAAEDAFWSYGYSTVEQRALFLNTIADEIEVRADAITEIAKQETGLPIARLQGERGRTVGQLRLFAAHILKRIFWIAVMMLHCLKDSLCHVQSYVLSSVLLVLLLYLEHPISPWHFLPQVETPHQL